MMNSFFLIAFIHVSCSVSGIDVEGFHSCADALCEKAIAEGRTVGKYISGADGLLSFQTGLDVTIFSKEGKGNPNYWNVEIQGKRGFAPKTFIMVTSELIKDLPFEVPIKGKYANDPPTPPSPNSAKQQPDTATTTQNVDKTHIHSVNPPQGPPTASQSNLPSANEPIHVSNTDLPSTPSVEKPTTTITHAEPEIQIIQAHNGINSEPSSDNNLAPNIHSGNAFKTGSTDAPSEVPASNNTGSEQIMHKEENHPTVAPVVEIPTIGEPKNETTPEQNALPQVNTAELPRNDIPVVEQNSVPMTEVSQEPSHQLNEPQKQNMAHEEIKVDIPVVNSIQQESVESVGIGVPVEAPLDTQINQEAQQPEGREAVEISTSGEGAIIKSEADPQFSGDTTNEIVINSETNQETLAATQIKDQEMNANKDSEPTEHVSSTHSSTLDPASISNVMENTSISDESMMEHEPHLLPETVFEKDEFYKQVDDVDYDDEETNNKDVDNESKKNIVNQVLEEHNNVLDANKDDEEESSSLQPADPNEGQQLPHQFHYANQYTPQESESHENNEDNHVEPPASSENNNGDELQHYDYIGGNVNPPPGSEEINESVGQNSSPDNIGVIPMFTDQSTDSSQETDNFFDRIIQDIYPTWVHDVIHINGFQELSSEYCLCLIVSAFAICIIYFIKFLMEKTSRESPLKARVALLDKQLFQCKNDNLIIKKKLETNSSSTTCTNVATKTVFKQETPSHIIQELEQLKEEREKLLNDSYNYQLLVQEKSTLEADKDKLQSLYDQSQQELLEAENIVQECLEEKKQAKAASSNNGEMLKALQTLEDQLNSQKQAVLKYESKVKKRDSELKEKIQELRKLRADTANAKLETDRISTEKNGLLKRIQALEGIDKEREIELDSLRKVEKDVKGLKFKLSELKECVETKESELEAKNTEIEVLTHTVGTLKCIASASETDNPSSDGWDFQETSPNIDLVEELSRCKVDLKKATDACNNLSEQLTKIEGERDEFHSTLETQKEEWEVALKIKDQVLSEKEELQHKHNVLSNYFNQREAELQKQLGLQSARLNDAEQGTESSSKKMMSINEELESYKSQLKTLKMEMEEMERSWKSQNANLEKKQHESWVTVRQEARKNAEAQNEMQTLRSRLTVTEAKTMEKEVELKRLSEENTVLKETIQNISTSQPLNNILKSESIYPNGHNISVLPISNGKSSGTPSVSSMEPPPPELPPLPFLPPPQMLPMMPMLPHNQSIMDTHRPAPVGRRSPTRGGNGGRYSRSPSPGYYNNRSSNMFRDSSPGSRSDRSRFDYSPSPPYRRHSSREHSPDRFSTRSDRSEISHHPHPHSSRHRGDTTYRDTPPRESRHHYSRRSSNEFPGSGLDDEDDEYRRSKRSVVNRTRNNNNSKTSRNKNNELVLNLTQASPTSTSPPALVQLSSNNVSNAPPSHNGFSSTEGKQGIKSEDIAQGREIKHIKLSKPEGHSRGFLVVELRSEFKGELGIYLQGIQPD
ncbi:unnamed protein product [Lepeophtheirus salmonis]|uniref:(salmon louse) hypothetical protein n=1 Tax=Lepeophtheirus salmonis TaxID=72036 RepID=A0A7R8CK62_LEPSM|nr:unnamed protein product [Lepeophtheirus salmonis]CAF2844355.1 unnamed protein product [Lepeophtheirus salmonis]